jgi:hypothetical protein
MDIELSLGFGFIVVENAGESLTIGGHHLLA